MTHVKGYDYVLLVPMHIDNVSPPYVDRDFSEVQNHDEVYQNMLETMCRAYVTRWHMG